MGGSIFGSGGGQFFGLARLIFGSPRGTFFDLAGSEMDPAGSEMLRDAKNGFGGARNEIPGAILRFWGNFHFFDLGGIVLQNKIVAKRCERGM